MTMLESDADVFAMAAGLVLLIVLCAYVASIMSISVEVVRPMSLRPMPAPALQQHMKTSLPYDTYRRFLAHQIEMYLDDNTDVALTRFLASLLKALDQLEEKQRLQGALLQQQKLPADVVCIVIHRLFKAVESPTPTYPREVWLSLSGVLQALAAIETTPDNMRHTLLTLHDRYEAVRLVWRSPIVLAWMRALLPDCVPAEWDAIVPPLERRRFYMLEYDLPLCEDDAFASENEMDEKDD